MELSLIGGMSFIGVTRINVEIEIEKCNSLLFGSVHDVTSHLQHMRKYAVEVI